MLTQLFDSLERSISFKVQACFAVNVHYTIQLHSFVKCKTSTFNWDYGDYLMRHVTYSCACLSVYTNFITLFLL